MVKASAKMHRTTFKDLDIWQRMIDSIAKVTPNNLDILFQGKKCEIIISRKQ